VGKDERGGEEVLENGVTLRERGLMQQTEASGVGKKQKLTAGTGNEEKKQFTGKGEKLGD